MRVVNVRDFDIPSDENDYDELVAFADTMASIEEFDAYTKEEVIAMLTELQLEIEELDSRAGYDGGGMPTFSTDYIRKKKVNELIQQKINVLEENTDGMEQ